MKIRFVAVLVLVTCLLAGSLYSIPANGTHVTQFLSREDSASGEMYVGSTYTSFNADTFDDLRGVAQGTVTILYIDFSTGAFKSISCSGPAYANSVSVKPTSGDSSVNATLDPADLSSCSSYNVFAPVTISLTGQFDGISQVSQIGNDKSTYNGTSFKSNFTLDSFSETFTGTLGFASGPISGTAHASRFNERTRVK